jgi:hypothetical protein
MTFGNWIGAQAQMLFNGISLGEALTLIALAALAVMLRRRLKP